ncbi:uncharacterized protein N7458_009041 [Penicillium daleae]|uniref:Uncharacterized protein n=1 Tax=Penicillium daleae TaxID=63821 RepID=A0AAD6FXP0_9EURO|nr:uncharacterized protein N7458_009041 [Penicillium daleae]KAJ5438043.1 hypothetical protein N7458_009041 [Penicillium daleae]
MAKNRYVESLPILYGNEFRFLKRRELCTTFPNQVPATGLSSIRRVTLWWTLGADIQPHTSLQNKARYDLLWSALRSKYTALTHIRIFIDSAYLPPMKDTSRGITGDAQIEKDRLFQNAWLEGLEAMVEANKDLEVFEVHFYVKVYRKLRDRVKPWLKEKEEERKVDNGAVRYKAYKCRSTAIKWQGCPDGSYDGVMTDLSDGSSKIGIEDAKSRPAEFWLKKAREAENRK